MSIVENRKAFHDYFIEERYEAGIVLEGWEVKAIRGGRASIAEAYVMVRGAEIFLIGAHITPLPTASTHVTPDPTRTRKLLLNAEEIKRLIGKVEQRGYTLIPLNLHYTKGRIKLEVGLGRGKLKHDKRAAEREKEWNREKQRVLRSR
jgi:SsrA-binding protein